VVSTARVTPPPNRPSGGGTMRGSKCFFHARGEGKTNGVAGAPCRRRKSGPGGYRRAGMARVGEKKGLFW
jgi:hypothetical protein